MDITITNKPAETFGWDLTVELAIEGVPYAERRDLDGFSNANRPFHPESIRVAFHGHDRFVEHGSPIVYGRSLLKDGNLGRDVRVVPWRTRTEWPEWLQDATELARQEATKIVAERLARETSEAAFRILEEQSE